ncbi:hypothetical protein FI667_g7470, partial [Globisporangium splendens]
MSGITNHGLTVEELFASDVRCSYPSKVCTNYRAVKLNGTLHKLCEFHRRKANLNQKRLQQRRRVIRQQMTARANFGLNFVSQIDSAFSLSMMQVVSIQNGIVSVDFNALEGSLIGESNFAASSSVGSSSTGARRFALLEPAELEIRV